MDEDRIRAVINQRSAFEKSKLFVRRTTTQLINTLILVIGWAGIVLLQIYNIPIQEKLAKVKYLNQVSGLVPSICLAVINSVIPIVSKKITEFEAWDFQEDLVKQQVWRIYLAKIMNLTIFVVINLEMVTGGTWFWSFPLLAFNKYTAGQANAAAIYDCREDFFAFNFYQQVLSEFLVKIVAQLATAGGKKLIALIRRQKAWKDEYELSDEIVWLLYFQSLIWISMIFFPFIAIVSPIMMYILFKYCYFTLQKFQERPSRSSNSSVSKPPHDCNNFQDTGFYIMIFLNLTLVLITAMIMFFMSVPTVRYNWLKVCDTLKRPIAIIQNTTHLCGPFLSEETAKESLQTMIMRHSAVLVIYDIFSYYPYLWLTGLILMTLTFLRRNHASILRNYVAKKDIVSLNRVLIYLNRSTPRKQRSFRKAQ